MTLRQVVDGAEGLPTCVLHIGHAKCGSSAIQTALSAKPSLVGSDGTHYEYVAIVDTEHLLRGEDLCASASLSPWGYASSLSSTALAELPRGTVECAVRELSAIRQNGTVPILSCESWFAENHLIESPLLIGEMISAHAVLYVRPHVEWINSAWWQWGAWIGQTFDEWFDTALDEMLYERSILSWAKQSGIERFTVRPLPQNIVEDFARLFGITDIPKGSVNRGPGATIMRLFQRHRELRPDPHASAIDFIVERLLQSNDSAKPWVLDQARVKRVLDAAHQDTMVLRNYMDSEQAANLECDPRWTEPSAYEDFDVVPAEVQPPSTDEIDELAAAALGVIQRLDDEVRLARLECERMTVERKHLVSELHRAHASYEVLSTELQQLRGARSQRTWAEGKAV